MAWSISNAERDGDMMVVTVEADTSTDTEGVGVTTAKDVVGHIKQISVQNPSGVSSAFNLVLEDTANNMELFSGSVDSSDIKTTSVNTGSGAYCRGPLKAKYTGTKPSQTRTIKIYIEKM
tara:strand:- start:8449 stop:8808 length:360 start_codon:yes stop_codon:yes gene_type:complete